jgi:hypothetical protein
MVAVNILDVEDRVHFVAVPGYEYRHLLVGKPPLTGLTVELVRLVGMLP